MTLFCITAAVIIVVYREIKNRMGNNDHLTIRIPIIKRKSETSV